MKFLVVSSAPTFFKSKIYSAYAPYVNEMDIWFSKVEEIAILSPGIYPNTVFTKAFENQNLKFYKIPFLNFKSVVISIKSLLLLPFVIRKMILAFLWADHIHLRCPGNLSLIGCIVQVFFPNKKKTVKYAGNWDLQSKQPWSYRLQKWIVSNSFLSKNIKVLVYGEWKDESKNILPFFTASFSELELEVSKAVFNKVFKFIFVGTLSEGKRPLFAIQLVESLLKKNTPVNLEIFGAGPMEDDLIEYITRKNLHRFVKLMGNRSLQELKKVYQSANFLILASKSEGWPKAIAEAMYFGCIPIATSVSCIPWMLNHGKRGILIAESPQDFVKTDKYDGREKMLEDCLNNITQLMENPKEMQQKSLAAQNWSRQYTLEKFELAICNLIN